MLGMSKVREEFRAIVDEATGVQPLSGSFIRASGDCVCDQCGDKYFDHPSEKSKQNLDWEGRPFLRRLCDGTLVKL